MLLENEVAFIWSIFQSVSWLPTYGYVVGVLPLLQGLYQMCGWGRTWLSLDEFGNTLTMLQSPHETLA